MNTNDIMSDQFYAPILFSVESRIAAADRQAQSQKLELTDSQVRSILNKVRKSAEGGAPNLPEGHGREAILSALHKELVSLGNSIEVETEEGEVERISLKEWLLIVKTIENSIRIRTGGAGSRDYLDYIHDFLQSGDTGYLS